MLKTEYVRDGKNQILGSTTTGFANGDIVARDRSGQILGHSNSTFQNTRDEEGQLVSQNSADVGLLFRR
jgi:YD repeat-containing protein